MEIMMRRKKRNSRWSESNELAVVKAAAWAWYEHGSGSEGKATQEFDAARRDQRRPSMPSRYKLEAMRNREILEMKTSHPARPYNNSLLDSYEIESISNRLNHLMIDELLGKNYLASDIDSDVVGDERESSSSSGKHRCSRKKKSNKLKGFFLPRHATVVCGRSQDVDDRAFRDDRRRRTPEKQIMHGIGGAHVID